MTAAALSSPPAGRRDRNMREKRRRIFDAATALFDERGYHAVTTQEVSERADIAVGTLFRYAATKNELLLLIYNEKLRHALERGAERARHSDDLVDAIMKLILPMVELASDTSRENGRAYQRELLFGAPGEPHRQEGLALIAGLQESICARLTGQAIREGLPADADAARLAGSSIFAVTHLVISRASTGAHPEHDPMEDLRAQVRQIVHGYFAALSTSNPRHRDGSDEETKGDQQ